LTASKNIKLDVEQIKNSGKSEMIYRYFNKQFDIQPRI